LPASEKRVQNQATHLDEFVPAYQFGEFHAIRIKAPRERVFQAIREVTPDEITLFRTLTWIRRFGRSEKQDILNAPPNEPILALAARTSFMKLAEEADREIVLGTLVVAPQGTQLKSESTGLKTGHYNGDPTPEDFKALQAPQPSTLRPGSGVESQEVETKQGPNAESTEGGAQSSQRRGFALAAINFRLEDAANGETVLTTETRVYATDASSRKRFAAYWRVIYPGSALIRVMWLRAIRNRAEKMPG
jgi:hypothetical protein